MGNKKTSRFGWILGLVMAVYALIFCVVAYFGLGKFWDYIAAYEASRPDNAVNAYMQRLNTEYVQDHCNELISAIDHNIQSEESCRQAIADALQGGITCAKRSSESTDTQMVYMLLSNKQTIGKFYLRHTGEDAYGFPHWKVEEDRFDLSFLLGQGITVTAPNTYSVYVNGVLLGQEYIVKSNIPYPAVSQYYETCDLPYLVEYEIPAILGNLEAKITTPDGVTVSQEEALNDRPVLNNCSEELLSQLDPALDAFLDFYMKYVTNYQNDISGNFKKLSKYIVSGSSLATRMKNAKDGLKWVSDRGARITSVEVPYKVDLGNSQYLCDVTYVITYRNGTEVTDTVHLIFSQTEDGLKAESMISH